MFDSWCAKKLGVNLLQSYSKNFRFTPEALEPEIRNVFPEKTYPKMRSNDSFQIGLILIVIVPVSVFQIDWSNFGVNLLQDYSKRFRSPDGPLAEKKIARYRVSTCIYLIPKFQADLKIKKSTVFE